MNIIPPASWKTPDNHIHVLLQSPWYKIMVRLYKSIFEATHEFYKQEQIFPMMFPITTGAISSPMGKGSDSVPVQIEIKDNKVYLADSMQFSLEIGTRLSQKGAYYIMPTFRGEQTDERHLNEFIHSEVEIPGHIDDIMSLAERYIKYLIQYLLKHNADDIANITGDVKHMKNALAHDFIRISYQDALIQLQNVPNALSVVCDNLLSITKIGEKHLIGKYGDFTWLTDLPHTLVPFYQAKQPNSSNAYAADLLAGIGEILGCGQRVLSPEDLDKSLAEHDVDANAYAWYRQMREIQPMQTSGFGLGIERFILWVIKHNDIRDCTILLRDHNNISAP
ncbi:MAG: asparaginase [Alphaproteobacteria bacterium]|nr:asparaginase [Alphaproteobacteria bacterium]